MSSSSSPIRILYQGDVYEIYPTEIFFYEGNRNRIPVLMTVEEVPEQVIKEYKTTWLHLLKQTPTE